MRVIAGSAKSMPLKTIPGMETRPTTDRIKETLLIFFSPICASPGFWIFLPEAVELELRL